MRRVIKHILIYLVSALLASIVIDVVFQQSKIISGLHAVINKNGTFFRPNTHTYFFNEGVGIQYTNTEGLVVYNPDKRETWNLYGDSFIEALQIFQRHHFAQTLAENKDVTIRNLGQSSMNFESMYARYFYAKEKYPANKHIFFISSDDFDTDDIGHFLALPEFDSLNQVIENVAFTYQETIQRRIERRFYNSSLLMLAKSDLRQVKNGQTLPILFDKLYFRFPEKQRYPDLVQPKRVFNLLQRLSQEPNIVWIYRGKEPMSSRYRDLFKIAGISVIDLQKAIEHQKPSVSYYYHKVTNTFGHWNREGHTYIAEFLANEL